mgnify:CR=1 FL=1
MIVAEFTVRVLTKRDYDYEDVLKDIEALAQGYVEESGLSISFNRPRAAANIRNFVESDSSDVIVLFNGRDAVGVVCLVFEALWSLEEFCMLYLFYIEPEFRNHLSSSKLFSSAMRMASRRDATHIFANTMVRMGDRVTKSYETLLKFNGFSEISPVYVKDI